MTAFKLFIITSLIVTTVLATMSYKHSKDAIVTQVTHAAACNSTFAVIADNYSKACK